MSMMDTGPGSGYRNWLSVLSRSDNAPYATLAEHESPDASFGYDRYQEGM
jgi:hypothetical protein